MKRIFTLSILTIGMIGLSGTLAMAQSTTTSTSTGSETTGTMQTGGSGTTSVNTQSTQPPVTVQSVPVTGTVISAPNTTGTVNTTNNSTGGTGVVDTTMQSGLGGVSETAVPGMPDTGLGDQTNLLLTLFALIFALIEIPLLVNAFKRKVS